MTKTATDQAASGQRDDQAEFIGVAELARILGIGRNRCYELGGVDGLPVPTIRIGRSFRFSRRAVERLGLGDDDQDRRG